MSIIFKSRGRFVKDIETESKYIGMSKNEFDNTFYIEVATDFDYKKVSGLTHEKAEEIFESEKNYNGYVTLLTLKEVK